MRRCQLVKEREFAPRRCHPPIAQRTRRFRCKDSRLRRLMPDPLSTQMMFQAAGFFNRRSHSSAARSAASCEVRRLKIRFSRRRAAFRCWLTQALDDQIGQAREHVTPIAGELDGCRQQGRSNLDRGRKDHERLKVPSLNKRSGRWIGFLKAFRTLGTPSHSHGNFCRQSLKRHASDQRAHRDLNRLTGSTQ